MVFPVLSTHNYRIERLWMDLHCVALRQFQNLFHYMETYLLGPVKLKQATLGVWEDVERSFQHCGGSVKHHVHASLSVQRVPNGSFDHCGGLVKLCNGISNSQEPQGRF